MSVNILKSQLFNQFNITSFREGQEEIINDVMHGKDVLGILPTGSGKSLCYQLPATIMEGVTIVVSPLISLMQDQVKQLKSTGFKSVIALNSFLEPKEKRRAFEHLNEYKLIYISPEFLQQSQIIDYLKNIKISLFVVDEAHCISQWGHEFRPDYLRLGSILEKVNNPTVLALSATATKEVQEDIIYSLNRPNIQKHIYPMDRENISFTVQKVNRDIEKKEIIINLLKSHRVPTLIYFSSKRKTEEIAAFLSENVPSHRTAFYHGDMDQLDRITIQQQFMNDQIDVICCTSAFGMGINKHNIRLVLHYHFPLQIESYIQEIGRAGRDGESSVSLLLYTSGDELIPNAIIGNELPRVETLDTIFMNLYRLYLKSPKFLSYQDMQEKLQLNETEWRFLHYQMEKHGMIKGNKIIYQRDIWNKALLNISDLIKKRNLLKEQKLKEIISWIHEEECLRKHLYKSFQNNYKSPLYGCCSNCGFTINEWNAKQTEVNHVTHNWENKLRNLLLNGVQNG
ncbi:ATP-dependent DNA helicase RecQ [Virgibacillus salinus]|uniref:ATP-dependent DNA helicase RecQ n=1 Tax=Virgibacillus salinus TaxID=553311 RepID=A0A1H1BP26_9BACI|nr:ATP-dependent DNA helicase RecQ [Virgibacillus salinus]